MNWRMTIILILFLFLDGYLVYNLYNLQVEKGDWYVALAQARGEAAGDLIPARGNIYFTDKNGTKEQAVLNREYPIIYAVPKEIVKEEAKEGRSSKAIASILSPLVSISESELAKRLSKKSSEYDLLASKASENLASEIKKIGIKGIYSRKEKFRYYAFGDIGAHIIGFASLPQEKEKNAPGGMLIGRYGVEQFFDESLRGSAGKMQGDRVIEPKDGMSIDLTIDRIIQSKGEDILRSLVEEHKAAGGTFIVEEPLTGRILGMGNIPSFDPNSFSASNVKNFLNPAVQAVYEPGSIFKVITMAAGIDSGKISPDTEYFDKGSVTLNGRTITNWDFKTHGAYGKQTMTNVIEHSINTGAVFAEQKTGHDIFYNYLIKFGLNASSGIKLPGEVKGSIKNLDSGREIDFATASYGQGVSVTPLALINAVSAIANGGLLMRPLMLASEKPEVIRRVIKEETAGEVTRMMISSVIKNKIASIPNYGIAGKTGTAFIPDFGRNGYTDQVINTFVGFAPASTGESENSPRFIVLIKLDKPAGSPLAGQTVVPAFHEFTQFLLNYFNIPPNKTDSN